MRKENGVWCAFEAGPDICSEILKAISRLIFSNEGFAHIDWANKVRVAHQYIGHANSKDYGEHPSSNKTLDCLLGRKLNKLCSPNSDSHKVCEDIVANDQGNG